MAGRSTLTHRISLLAALRAARQSFRDAGQAVVKAATDSLTRLPDDRAVAAPGAPTPVEHKIGGHRDPTSGPRPVPDTNDQVVALTADYLEMDRRYDLRLRKLENLERILPTLEGMWRSMAEAEIRRLRRHIGLSDAPTQAEPAAKEESG